MEKMKDLLIKSTDELIILLKEKKHKLGKENYGGAESNIKNPRIKGTIRKDIARIKTIIQDRKNKEI